MFPRITAFVAVLAAVVSALPAFAQDEPFPREWYWGDDAQWAEHKAMLGKPAPEFGPLSDWINGQLTRDQLRGKIVVVDYWATWCGPCKANLPKGNDIMATYGDRGVVMLGICSSRGQEKMKEVAQEKGVKFPMAKDATQRGSKAWAVKWWPTYAVVDRKGDLRAIGLRPDFIDDMVEKLLAEQPAEDAQADAGAHAPQADAAAGAATPIPAALLEGSPEERARFADLEGRPAPALQLTGWLNSPELALDELRGKVVLLDFWATWCGPCIASIPKVNELQAEFADQGLVVIGVCHPRGAETMSRVAQEKGIRYPVAADTSGQTIAAYKVSGYPDYYLIDRAGNLRIADCRNGSVRDAVQLLLAEPAEAQPVEVAAAE